MAILKEIVQHTRELVGRRRKRVPEAALRERAAFHAPTLSLADALRGDELAVMAEIKRSSPSKGPIRPDLEPGSIARRYRHGGAAAISVLTEPDYFDGSLADLAEVRSQVDVPVLRKDFVIDPYQLLEARAFGADAVLLIATALEEGELRDLHGRARELGLSVLVEAYGAEDLEKIDFDAIDVLGVNNRDLRSFEVDVAHSLELFESVPSEIVRVSESGLSTGEDLARVRSADIDAVLVGEAFMRAPDPGVRLAEVQRACRRMLARSAGSLRRVS